MHVNIFSKLDGKVMGSKGLVFLFCSFLGFVLIISYRSLSVLVRECRWELLIKCKSIH